MKSKIIFIAIMLFAGYQYLYKTPEVSARSIDSSCDAVVFTTANCPYCKQARQLLNEENVNWCEKDINKSSANKKLFKQLGGRGVPFAVIGSETLKGYSKYNYKKAISKI